MRTDFKNQKAVLSFALAVVGGLGWVVVMGRSPALAQEQPPPLSLTNVARYYEGLPHQDRALWLLQQQISTSMPELLQPDSIVANVWRNSETLTGHIDILDQIPVGNRRGTDPLNLALSHVDLRTGAPVQIEVLTGANVESPEAVMVTITEGGVLDDSVAGIRYRFDIRQSNGQWEIRRAGQQVRCQVGRGHQDWSDVTCL